MLPCRRGRPANDTSIHSACSRSFNATSANASFFAKIAELISFFSAFSAGPATFFSSGVILPSSRIFKDTSPFLPTAATRTFSSADSSLAPEINSKYFCVRSFMVIALNLSRTVTIRLSVEYKVPWKSNPLHSAPLFASTIPKQNRLLCS